MLKQLRRGHAAGVIIHKIDRSTRNLEDWAKIGELIDQGIAVHFADEPIDLQSIGGRLAADMQAVVAAHYVRNLKAPIGYLDCGGGKPKAIDPVAGPPREASV
jgi:site-specific DNA recombinase